MAATLLRPPDNPMAVFEEYTGWEMPDPLDFIVSPTGLNRPNLYPRQATVLKIMFLRDDQFTDYDHDVIGGWIENWRHTADDEGVGNNGIQPDIYERIALCKAQERKWFRETQAVWGRRGSKGHVGALAGAVVLWTYMGIGGGDPQDHFGVDRDKKMAMQVFAGKKEQAKTNQWGDIFNVITGAPCFSNYISRALGETLTVFAPHDKVRIHERLGRGVESANDMATFVIQPLESTVMASRGPAAFSQFYDEMAHVVKGVAKAEAEAVWTSATPALDQFGKDAFVYQPSSPWQMLGQFYVNYRRSLEVNPDGSPTYPDLLMTQLTSWDIYTDWEKAHTIEMWPGGRHFNPLKRAMQEYDDNMVLLEKANPETFRVERRCLDPETRVLCADLAWRPIKSLRPGDEVVGVDEEPPGVGAQQRRMRTAVVEAVSQSVQPAYRIEFDDGTHVVCSANHRWLSASREATNYRWRKLFADPHQAGPRQSIRVGDRIRYLVDPWEPDDSWEAGYLAGVYDGEGTVLARHRSEFCVSFVQNDNEVLDLTLSLLKEKGFETTHRPNLKRPCQTYLLRGFDQAARFIGQIGGAKMARQGMPNLWEGRGMPRPVNRGRKYKTVTGITALPPQVLIDIQTSTKTFIAEGLVSHNSHFAAALNAYLNQDKIATMWKPWPGEEDVLTMKSEGRLAVAYRAHGDPSKSGANFGFAIGHAVYPEGAGLPHVVFDLIKHWAPGDFEDHEIDYEEVGLEVEGYMDAFMPGELTFDQFNSVATIQRLQKHALDRRYPKQVQIYERTATGALNWKTYETFKTALGMGLVHAPFYDLLNLELTFLQDIGHNKVDHPTSGPVQTKDVADCVAIVVYELIGEQMALMASQLGGGLSATAQGGFPTGQEHAEQAQEALSAFTRSRGARAGQMTGGGRRRRR